MLYSHSNRDYMIKRRKKTINPKYMTTNQLKSFRDNGYVGKDGLDREQYKEEIDSVYYERMNKLAENDLKCLMYELDEYQSILDELPPSFPFTWDEETNEYTMF